MSNLSSAQASLAAAQQGQTAAEAKAAAAAVASSRAQVQSASQRCATTGPSPPRTPRNIGSKSMPQEKPGHGEQPIDERPGTVGSGPGRRTTGMLCGIGERCMPERYRGREQRAIPSRPGPDLDRAGAEQPRLGEGEPTCRPGPRQADDRAGCVTGEERGEILRSTIASNRVSAQANVDPSLVAQSRASVTSAQVQVDQAREALAGTVLRARPPAPSSRSPVSRAKLSPPGGTPSALRSRPTRPRPTRPAARRPASS